MLVIDNASPLWRIILAERPNVLKHSTETCCNVPSVKNIFCYTGICSKKVQISIMDQQVLFFFFFSFFMSTALNAHWCVCFPSKESPGTQKWCFSPHFWQQPWHFLWNKYEKPVANANSKELSIKEESWKLALLFHWSLKSSASYHLPWCQTIISTENEPEFTHGHSRQIGWQT